MSNGDERYVTEEHLHRLLTKVNHVLQTHSQAISNLRQRLDAQDTDTSQAYQNTNRIAQIETHLNHIREDIKHIRRTRAEHQREHEAPTGAPVEQEDYSPQIREIENRIAQIERLEKSEEYDQNILQRDFEQMQREFETLQRDFETAQRQIRNMQKQLKSRR